MKLALNYGYWDKGPIDRFIELAERAEALGFDAVFTAEAYGSDVFTPLAAIASRTKKIRLGTGIMQISARTPAAAAMAAMSLDHISNGRLLLGVGVSGPQVVEGWYGQSFARPLERTREWLSLFRQIIAREGPVSFEGKHYQLPYKGENATGLGKPLGLITHPLRKAIPVLLGAEGPKNVELAFSEFDGWLAAFLPPNRMDLFDPLLSKMKPGFEIVLQAYSAVSDDFAEASLPVRKQLALYCGGMGAKEQNFHKNFIERIGFAAEANRIQDLWLSGRQADAVNAVTDEMVNEIALVGSKSALRERLKAYKASKITTLGISRGQDFDDTVRKMEFFANEVL